MQVASTIYYPHTLGQERKSVAAPKQPTYSKPKYGFSQRAEDHKDSRLWAQAHAVQDNGCNKERNRN